MILLLGRGCVVIWFGFSFFLFAVLISLSLTDLRRRIIPNTHILALLVGGICFSWVYDTAGIAPRMVASLGLLAAGILVAGIAARLLRREALGMGDVKLYAVAALWLGLSPMPLVLTTASALALVALMFGLEKQGAPLAFGPYLSVAIFGAWLWQMVGVQA
ncbi:A24 family peptidase (plasmid) [Aliiroseovarius crassostreae]|uniref:prepilin peptidase n=1 Tax=Aliiroseovarius crassostreae TaxID=154981 RepID=UPI00220A99D3|nr:A24 family peptidase [Aliiroseovarius crassostreae]UWQ12800.1 A24 family peptidase [Aliiroseovarius crassostreae]